MKGGKERGNIGNFSHSKKKHEIGILSNDQNIFIPITDPWGDVQN